MTNAAILFACVISFCVVYCGTSIPETRHHPGEVLYKKYRCISCHGSKGTTPFNLTDSKMDFTYDNLRKYIDNPRAFGNEKMPAFEGMISDVEYKDVIDYVIKLKNDATKKD
jgi:mono/diheme cytochrome c family protein